MTMGIKLLVRAPMMLICACVLAITISPKLAMIFLVSIPVLVISIGLIIKTVNQDLILCKRRLIISIQ